MNQEMEVTVANWIALSDFPAAVEASAVWGAVGIVISGNGPTVSILMVL